MGREKTSGPAGQLLTSEISKTTEPRCGRAPGSLAVWLAACLLQIAIFEVDTSSATKTCKKQKTNLPGFILHLSFAPSSFFSSLAPHRVQSWVQAVFTNTFCLCTPSLSWCLLLSLLSLSLPTPHCVSHTALLSYYTCMYPNSHVPLENYSL